jgi:hypothetical protein
MFGCSGWPSGGFTDTQAHRGSKERRQRGVPTWPTTGSSGNKEVVQFWSALTVFKTIRNNWQRDTLCFRQCLAALAPISEQTGKRDHFGEPATVCFLLELHSKRLLGRGPSLPCRSNTDAHQLVCHAWSSGCLRPHISVAGPCLAAAAKRHDPARPPQSCNRRW